MAVVREGFFNDDWSVEKSIHLNEDFLSLQKIPYYPRYIVSSLQSVGSAEEVFHPFTNGDCVRLPVRKRDA